MSDKLIDMRDVEFLLYEMLNIEELPQHDYFSDHSRETFDMALKTAYQLAREKYWPAYQEFDRDPARFDGEKTTAPAAMHELWKAAKDGGWFAPSAPYDAGGQQFPFTVFLATSFMLNAGNTAACMYIGQATGAGHLIEEFGSDFLRERFMYKLYAGEWGGTMALTEPQAGTSLGDITTTAVKAEDGDHYMIKGVKRFISSGDHDLTENIIHPTLARIEGAPPGVKGISLFVIPKYRVNDDGSVGESNDVLTGGIEHKLGLKGQATATLQFGENDRCRGWLLGEPNQGLRYMFQLMNTARIHTGIQAIAQASTAYHCALQYCYERVQGREVTERDPTTPQVPIIKHHEVKRMLLTQKAYVEGVVSLLLYCAKLGDNMRVAETEEEKKNDLGLLEILTPVCKAYASDVAYESISLAVQCYGGAGYIEEYPIAQLLRDNRVFSIYEGTNQIQAMDLLGRKVAIEEGAYFKLLLAEIGQTIGEASGHTALGEMSGKVGEALQEIIEVTQHLAKLGLGGEVEQYISYASPYLRMFSQLVIGWQFLKQSIVAETALANGTNDEDFYHAKLGTARFYIDTIMPTNRPIAKLILAGDRSSFDYKEEWFRCEAGVGALT
ncbi:MAG: acyl-CoA dehydrogenase [Candidatus Hydrogenedentes bacterium]|nr:acyl-CoA dehydrogenase [Candidatus Hydrogenedentota bacterium]